MSGLPVQRKQCATCIYKPGSPLDLRKLENDVRDRAMPGHFARYRICHHSTEAVCRGFWNRHRANCSPLQLAERLGVVEFVDHDTMEVKLNG